METKTCSQCGFEKDRALFPKRHGNICLECRNANQRAARSADRNASTKKYEKTPKGFVMRLYRNMKSRVTGVQKQKAHLYLGKSLLSKEEFLDFVVASPEFWRLFTRYERSGYDRKLAPTVDRVNSAIGYEVGNMEWVTHSENSRRGTMSKIRRMQIDRVKP